MKKILSILLTLTMLFALSTTLLAASGGNNILLPRWNYMSSISMEMEFDEDIGTVSVIVTKYHGITTKLEGTLTVYEQVGTKWKFIDSTTESSSTTSLNFDFDFPAESGVKYKAELTVTAYGNGGSETETVSETETCP